MTVSGIVLKITSLAVTDLIPAWQMNVCNAVAESVSARDFDLGGLGTQLAVPSRYAITERATR